MEWTRADYTLSDEPARVDLEAVHDLLRETYWAKDRPQELTRLAVENSLCFSLWHGGEQVGLARVLTDHGATSYVCDVVLREDHRSKSIGSWVMGCILDHPAVRQTRVLLITRDAQEFYRRLGFETHPYECMLRKEPSAG